MVDSIGSGGQIPKVQSSDNLQKVSEKKETRSAEERRSVSRSDEVEISEEALSLSNAQKAAEEVGAQLSEISEQTLSADEERLNALI